MPDKPTPMTDADVLPAANDPGAIPPLKTTGDTVGSDHTMAESSAASHAAASETAMGGATVTTRQAVRDHAGKLGQQATDKLRMLADDGKARAGGALDQVAQLLTDAAGQVDDKLGEQYGRYARDAAGQVQGFADGVRNKDVDELLDDARGFVRASPAVAIGVAAALGFATARLVQAGVDDARA